MFLMVSFNVMIPKHGQTNGKRNHTHFNSNYLFLSVLIRPSFSTHGVISGSSVGQSDFQWSIRSNPEVKKIFSRIWNTQQLLVSFDGCGIFRDWRYNPSWKTTGGWNHVDQNPKLKPDRCCIQGLVSLTDQSEKTGGLIVYPRTHLRFTELSDVTKNSNDFVRVSDKHQIMNDGKTLGKLVHCRAGDLILWDSRTVHCNSPATAVEELNKGCTCRFITYRFLR